MKDDRYWAPINVGAITAKNKAADYGIITADCGKLFQWGRKSGVDASGNPSTLDDTVLNNCPVGIEGGGLPDMSTWDGKHIITNPSNPDTQYNWLQFVAGQDNPEDGDMVTGAWYQQLWNANEGKADADVVKTATDPCPKGWRVPTQAEWIAIGAGQEAAVSGTTWDSSNLRLTVPGKESGKNLVLPAAGSRYSDGASYGQGASGYYWSSSVPAASTSASYVLFNSAGGLNTRANNRANGFSVRCVQE